MKRTRKLALTSLMAMGGMSLTACGGDVPTDNARIDNPGPAVDAYAYASLQECKDKNEIPDAACDTADKNAKEDEKKSATHKDQATCEETYGPGQCVPRSQASGGGSIWGPLLTGFVVGRMLDGGWGGRGMYRDWRDGGYYSTSGGRVFTDYSTGRTRIGQNGFKSPDALPPPKAMSRASVISRGGFGGRASSRSFGGSKGFGG